MNSGKRAKQPPYCSMVRIKAALVMTIWCLGSAAKSRPQGPRSGRPDGVAGERSHVSVAGFAGSASIPANSGAQKRSKRVVKNFCARRVLRQPGILAGGIDPQCPARNRRLPKSNPQSLVMSEGPARGRSGPIHRVPDTPLTLPVVPWQVAVSIWLTVTASRSTGRRPPLPQPTRREGSDQDLPVSTRETDKPSPGS